MKLNRNLKLLFAPVLACGLLWSCSDDSKQKYFAAKIDGSDRWSIVDAKTGEAVCVDEFKDAVQIDGELFWLENGNGNLELYDVLEYKTPLGDEFLDATAFWKSDVAVAVKSGEPISIINRKGEVVVTLPNDVTRASAFNDGLAAFQKGGVWGYMDESGKVVIEPQYSGYTPFSGDNAIVSVEKDGKEEIRGIDKSNEVLFSFSADKYDKVASFHNGYLAVQKDDRIILLGKEGAEAVKSSKMEAYGPDAVWKYWVNDDKLTYCNDGEWGLMTLDGETLIRPKYRTLVYLDANRYLAESEGRWNIIDAEGKEILPDSYNHIAVNYAGDNYLLEEDRSWILANGKGEQIGKDEYYEFAARNYTSSSVKSNYFDLDGAVAGLVEGIGTKNCFGIGSIGMPEVEKQGLLPADMNLEYYRNQAYFVGNKKLPVLGDIDVQYTFNGNISLPIVERVNDGWWSYDKTTGYKLNTEVRLISMILTFSLGEFDNQAIPFCKKLEERLIASGFKENKSVGVDGEVLASYELEGEGCLLSVDAYSDGSIVLIYEYKLADKESVAAANQA